MIRSLVGTPTMRYARFRMLRARQRASMLLARLPFPCFRGSLYCFGHFITTRSVSLTRIDALISPGFAHAPHSLISECPPIGDNVGCRRATPPLRRRHIRDNVRGNGAALRLRLPGALRAAALPLPLKIHISRSLMSRAYAGLLAPQFSGLRADFGLMSSRRPAPRALSTLLHASFATSKALHNEYYFITLDSYFIATICLHTCFPLDIIY